MPIKVKITATKVRFNGNDGVAVGHTKVKVHEFTDIAAYEKHITTRAAYEPNRAWCYVCEFEDGRREQYEEGKRVMQFIPTLPPEPTLPDAASFAAGIGESK